MSGWCLSFTVSRRGGPPPVCGHQGSLVKLESVRPDGIEVSGIDLLDGTPVIDIKPYLPWADCLPDAFNAIAPAAPEPLPVSWHEAAMCL